MSPRLRECRQSGREHERKDENHTDGIRARSNDPFNREPVEQPDWNHEQSQDNSGDDHGHAGGYAASVVVVDEFVIGLVSRFLLTDCLSDS